VARNLIETPLHWDGLDLGTVTLALSVLGLALLTSLDGTLQVVSQYELHCRQLTSWSSTSLIYIPHLTTVNSYCLSVKPRLQHSLTQRNIRVLTQQKKCCVLFTQLRSAATTLASSCGAPQANRNDFYFYSGGELDQSQLRLHSTNGCGMWNCAVRCVIKYSSRCGAAIPSVTLRYGMLETMHQSDEWDDGSGYSGNLAVHELLAAQRSS